MQHQGFWTPTAGGQAHTLERRLNVASRQWMYTSCEFVLYSCAAATVGTPNSSAAERQELLWRQYFLDPTLWWDCRTDKNSARSPDFRHKEFEEPLWPSNFCKPDWVDGQLAVLDKRVGRPAQPTSNPVLHHNAVAPTVPECQGYGKAQAVIDELCENGQLSRAVDALTVLAETQSRVSTSLLYKLIRRCGAEKNLAMGRRLDDLTVKVGYESNAFLGNHVLRMYACQGRLQEAMEVFKRVAEPDVFMWFSIISAVAELGKPSQAIQLYHEMRRSGLEPNNHIFVAALQACARAEDVKSGRQVHADVLESGIQHNSFVSNCLVDMYAKCGELEDARRVFDSMATRNVMTWNAMITGYAKCGKLEDARKLFDSLAARNAVTWNAMINGYAEHGLSQKALALYESMKQEGLILADRVTYVCLLKACASAGALLHGRQLHSEIVERGLFQGDRVGTGLVNMYAKCGKLEDAREVFDSLSTRDAATWTAMINGYAEHGFGPQALALYASMEQEGLILADSVTFACLLKACTSAGALQQGRQLHSEIVERGLFEGDIVLGNCLVNMYAKFGQLEDARKVFDNLPTRDAVTWNAMINGYGRNNEGHKATACFEEMIVAGVQPNDTTFTCLLVACSQEGLVSKGRQYFDAMVKQHGMNPTAEHYNCMVDLLGRAGHLGEAEKMLLSIGCDNDAAGLMSLLNACKSYGDIERGTRCFESLVELDPQAASAYVLMANMYADADRWGDVDRIERLRKLAGANKKPAVAGIEVNKQVHTFVVGEERGDISSKVRSTNERLKEEGNHVPHTKLVLKPVSEKEKEDQLCGHAEKLALAFGLLNTPDGTPLLLTKNLRMCGDCHSSTEVMSRVEKRDIVVRDAYRVHRFEAGSCSCKGRH